ncbi:metal ABC transporter solute-binding protein, Zn/Mn family [Halalkalibacter krulwichiae]|uniref:High-affinity zinc uptake system binding-protein ZnuA n=1 Tax=Halalkalibacter krulwichiae TaxID=199441 RepID=A0A1X9MKY4_9BACI|nr:zinc ABC transporter substrate-binding protein [Halalkalibacter krulwichiae]ARK31372.1 High-affinity zinc uptake system binding-protein ZnuA precursor [Halalkalibacter krulwichiae]
MRKLSSIFAFLLVLTVFLAACGGNEQEEQQSTTEDVDQESMEVLEIYTTIFPLEDFANKIGGEFVNVTNLVPVGADAHTFEPTAREMISVAEADAFIYNGAGLEGFVDALVETVDGESIAIVTASEGIDLLDYDHDHNHDEHAHEEEHDHDHNHDEHAHEEEHDHDHNHDEHAHDHDEDPHVWLDPILSITLAENIKNVLIELMPEQEDFFSANFEEVKTELEVIDQEFQAMVDAAEKDTFLVSHAGYGYWEDRYDIVQIGISGISPTNEPSQRQIQDIIELADQYGLEYVMFEQNIPTKIAEVVKGEVGAEALYLHNLEALVQEDVENGEDYFSLMRKNIKALETALQ